MAARAIRLFRRADDPEAFREAIADGNLDEARNMVDMTDEEFHDFVSEWREQAEELAEEHHQVAEANREEFFNS